MKDRKGLDLTGVRVEYFEFNLSKSIYVKILRGLSSGHAPYLSTHIISAYLQKQILEYF